MALNVQLRPLSQIDARTEMAWSALASRAVELNPFFEPIVAQAYARLLGLDLSVLTVERGGDMLLCLPLRKSSLRWHRLPLQVWTGWDPLSAPLVASEDIEALLRAAVEHLAGVRGPGFLVLDWVPSDGPLAAALASVNAGRQPAWLLARTFRARPALYRRHDGNYTGGTLHGKQRGKQGNKRRNLEKRLGAPLQLVDEKDNAEAIERLLAMERRGWKGRIGSAVLSRPDFATYFRDVCAHFARHDRMQVLSLQAAGTTVAMKADIRCGDALFGLRTAYEEAFAAASPGVELEIRAIEAFHASSARFWDSTTNHAKNPLEWLWPDKRPIARVVMSLNGVLGRIACSRAMVGMHSWIAGRRRAKSSKRQLPPGPGHSASVRPSRR